MSSFIVSTECMNNIIVGLYKNNHNIIGSLIDEKDMKKLSQKLYKMNQKAVKQRYDEIDNEYNKIPDLEIDYNINVSDAQLLKSLHCLKYQCSEGTVPKTRMYLILKKIIEEITYKIATDNDDYRKAEWG